MQLTSPPPSDSEEQDRRPTRRAVDTGLRAQEIGQPAHTSRSTAGCSEVPAHGHEQKRRAIPLLRARAVRAALAIARQPTSAAASAITATCGAAEPAAARDPRPRRADPRARQRCSRPPRPPLSSPGNAAHRRDRAQDQQRRPHRRRHRRPPARVAAAVNADAPVGARNRGGRQPSGSPSRTRAPPATEAPPEAKPRSPRALGPERIATCAHARRKSSTSPDDAIAPSIGTRIPPRAAKLGRRRPAGGLGSPRAPGTSRSRRRAARAAGDHLVGPLAAAAREERRALTRPRPVGCQIDELAPARSPPNAGAPRSSSARAIAGAVLECEGVVHLQRDLEPRPRSKRAATSRPRRPRAVERVPRRTCDPRRADRAPPSASAAAAAAPTTRHPLGAARLTAGTSLGRPRCTARSGTRSRSARPSTSPARPAGAC